MHRGRLLLAALCLATSSAAAGDLAIRRFEVAGHGALTLPVPDAWQIDVGSLQSKPLTIRLMQQAGHPFEMRVTPLSPALKQAALRRKVVSAATNLGPATAEKILKVQELGGSTVHGFYFIATDPAPKPGDYKYLTQGMLAVGGLTVAFTILTNPGDAAIIDAGLTILRAVGHEAGGGA
jgi:hypothetical protein